MKVVFIFLLDVVLVFGQAPGDYHDICRTNFRYRAPHDWIPYVNDTAVGVRGDVKWQVLVDQYDYQHILGQDSIPPGVWLQRDIDGDGVQFTQSGTTCTNTLRLRNTFRNSNSNNWVFTQAVSYLDAIEVIVNATVRFTGCQDRSSSNPPCQNNFVTLYRYDTNSTNEITNVTNFKPCFGDRASSRLEQTGSALMNVIKTFDRPNFAMTYFGIQDNGTYGDVRRILVYYRVAQGYEDGLVRCPNIPLPKEDSGESVSKNCTCKDNAMPVNSLTRTCNGNGVCEGNPMCVCQPGYQYDETQNVCQACDAGQYGRGGDTSCVACPANSTSTRASGYCPCIEGHFRYDISNIETECTAPPPPMTECTSNTAYDTGAVLQWRNPPHCGGRTDCFYQISINNGLAVRHDPTNFNFNALETYTVINLQPDTTYSITVSIHNGVSDQDADNAKVRECQIVVMTIPGSVFMLGGTTYLNNTAAVIEHIGEGEVNSLKCTTALETCCRSSGQGDFYYPNGAQVMIESGGENLYRTRSSRSISLNRRGGNTPLGEYRCEIPDGRGILQNLYITIGTNTNTECPVVCPTCPSCPTTSPPPTCGTPTTCTPSPGNVPNPIVFELGGTTYPNNTIVLLEDIGVGDSALLCVSNNTGCCTSTSSGFKGEFYYPNGSVVPIQSMQHSFYRNRGSGYIRLNQQLNAVTRPPLGRYRCDIQDDGGVTQSVFINIVQNMSCPTDICTPSPPVSTCPTPSVVNCDDCPTATAQTCPPPTTCPTSDGISFQFGGQTYPNNSVFLMTDIGADDMALMCVTDHTPCCRTSQEGEWFYPNNTPVSTSGAGMNFYRDRGSQTVRLNRRNNALSPTGRYRCTIPDATGTMQTLVANIIVESEGMCTTPSPVTCPTPPECTTPEPSTTVTCPDTPECNVPNPVVFELGGTTYPNNTIVLLEDIGVGDSALLCVSNNTGCCTSTSSGFKGEFYYPNGSLVPIQSMQHSFYRNRGSGFIRLNQQLNAVTPPPLGRYRCDIQDDGGVTQSVFINIVQNMSCSTDICTPRSTCPTPSVNCDDCPTATAQTCPPPTTCPTSDAVPDPNIRVVAVVNDAVVIDVSAGVLSLIDKYEVKIFIEDKQRISKRQTKDSVTFTVDNTEQPWFKIPSDKLNTLTKGSTYSVQVKPLFNNGAQGQYGSSFTFQFSGPVSESVVSSPESRVDMKFIALSIVLTFVITTIVVTLLVLVLVWLFLTCKERRSTKYNRNNGSDKPLELTNPYWDKKN